MTVQDIRKLAKQGEGLRIEFKKKAAYPEKIIKEIIAFANTEGGYLLIGVDDNGTVSGQNFIEEEVFILEKTILEKIFPKVAYRITTLQLNSKKGIAVFYIEKSEAKPHYLMEDNRKKAYVRVADRTIQASKEIWEILRRSRKPKDIVFTYGQKEDILMKALEQQGKITVNEFTKMAKLPKFMASRTLVRLVLANVLKIIPQESEDLFALKD